MMNKNFLVLVAVFLCMAFSIPVYAETSKETVVILHGIARTNASMKRVDKALRIAGYETLNNTYPSTKYDVTGVAKHLRNHELSKSFWKDARKVHFVTYSMGGLVAREYLDLYKDEIPRDKIGRVVMLAPPNKGSEVADFLESLGLYSWFYGPAGKNLTTGFQAKNTAKPYYDLGIIAGTREWPYIVAAFVVPGKSDGRVSVENTKLEGMSDHIEVSATHTFIMEKLKVYRQIIAFLQDGKFKRSNP